VDCAIASKALFAHAAVRSVLEICTYPCRYVITDPKGDQSPQYSVQISDWKTGTDVVPDIFSFKTPTDAKKVDDPKKLVNIDELPDHFAVGGTK
jgi:hypothetical protein